MGSQNRPCKPTLVNPLNVPQITLYTGARIPAIGLGTFGNDRYSADEIAQTVSGAAKFGYRLFDCASAYGNEKEIGQAFKQVMANGISREELCILSKVWNNMHGRGDVLISCAMTLKDLQVDYLDLYLVHWPFRNTHPKGAEPGFRDPGAKPYNHEDYMETWRQMERLVDLGLVKQIGVSNMTLPKLKLLLRDARIKPAVNEVELHPTFQQPELFDFCQKNDIKLIGYSPIGSPARPDRDRTKGDAVDIEDPVIRKIAQAHHVHPAVICLKWAVQRGQIPVPSTIQANEYESNLNGIMEDPLTEQEMLAIQGIDRNCRLIKGIVFLWKTAKDWTDLWDVDGEISQ